MDARDLASLRELRSFAPGNLRFVIGRSLPLMLQPVADAAYCAEPYRCWAVAPAPSIGSVMPLFYFDYNDGEGGGMLLDQVGTELANIDAALVEASRTMAELAADVIPGSRLSRLGIEVRDELGDTRLRVLLDYRVETAG